MRYVGYSINTGEENMRIDSELLDNSIESGAREPVFRLYAWSPKCISLGRNQKELILTEKIDCVRRLTGGRALLHDNEVTYSFISPADIIPNGENIIDSYKFISGILIDFFKTLDIKLEFGENKRISTHFDYCMLLSTGADVCYNGKKLIGSAQCRKHNYILQHGSILFDYDKSLLERLFKEEIQGITTIKEILPDLSKQEFISRLETFIKNR